MASVTIKLTVDTESLQRLKENRNMGTYCRLSQSGGENDGNHMYVNLLNSEENITWVSVGDEITWQGIPANPAVNLISTGGSYPKINIVAIVKESGGVILSEEPVPGEWSYGKTLQKLVIEERPGDTNETYKIYFLINGTGINGVNDTDPFHLDPKIRIIPHA